ncbi:MAG: hypothetical protein ACK4VY_09320 [Brevundimonas sp.]
MNLRGRVAAVAVLGLAGLSVGGCFGTPAYGPVGPGSLYGYTDTAIEGGRSIRVTLPSYTDDPQIAYVYWNRRAEEVCNGAILRKQIHTARQHVGTDYSRMNGIIGDYVLEGYVWCDPSASGAAEPAVPVTGAAPPETRQDHDAVLAFGESIVGLAENSRS